MKPAILISKNGGISAILNGQSFNVATDHPNYNRILQAVRDSAWDSFKALVDVASSVRSFVGNGKVSLVGGAIVFNGETLHNSITDRILNLMNKELPFKPMVKFLENLMENPSKRAVDELYGFLEHGNLPLTEDGHFLAFKNVRADWKDIHSGRFDNQIGCTPEMPRNGVDEDKDRTCSAGLHFCSQEYLPHFSSVGGHTIIVKINPRDVVAIPADYHNTKGRCCRYEVVAEMEGEPSNYTGRAVIGDFDPQNDDEDGEPTFSENYNIGYDRGMEDALKGIFNPEVGGSYNYYVGYNDAQDDFDKSEVEDEDCGDEDCECSSSQSEYGTKPSGHKFYNVHGGDGRFVAKS